MQKEEKIFWAIGVFSVIVFIYVIAFESYCRLSGNCKGDRQSIEASVLNK